MKGGTLMFCKHCGKEIPEDSNACQYCGTILRQKNITYYSNKTSDKRKISWKIIAPVVAVLLVIAIVTGIVSCVNIKKTQEREKLLEILGTIADKPVVEFYCEDFDGDGTTEAYAVAGKSAEKEYYDADFYFVNQTEAEVIKENVQGYANGLIETEDRLYVSLEVYDDATQKGFSYIYSAEGDESVEADISGKYSDVHEEDGKVIATGDDGSEIEVEIKITDKQTNEDSKVSEYIEATDEDWENFNKFLHDTAFDQVNYNRESESAYEQAYSFICGNWGSSVYYHFFEDEGIEQFSANGQTDEGEQIFDKPDPLGKLNKSHIYNKYPADKIDWIVKNIFRLEPNRKYIDDSCYYYGDYFYSETGQGGDALPEFHTKYERLSDGRYRAEARGDSVSYGYFGSITAVVGLKEVDGRRVWEISEFTTINDPKAGTGSAADYIGKTFGDVVEQFGRNYETFYFEGGDFIYYKDIHPVICFGGLKAGDNHSVELIKNLPIKAMLAYENARVYKDFYADMSYNDLKKLLPDIKRPDEGLDDSYGTGFILDGYEIYYNWNNRNGIAPSDDEKSSEVFIKRVEN